MAAKKVENAQKLRGRKLGRISFWCILYTAICIGGLAYYTDFKAQSSRQGLQTQQHHRIFDDASTKIQNFISAKSALVDAVATGVNLVKHDSMREDQLMELEVHLQKLLSQGSEINLYNNLNALEPGIDISFAALALIKNSMKKKQAMEIHNNDQKMWLVFVRPIIGESDITYMLVKFKFDELKALLDSVQIDGGSLELVQKGNSDKKAVLYKKNGSKEAGSQTKTFTGSKLVLNYWPSFKQISHEQRAMELVEFGVCFLVLSLLFIIIVKPSSKALEQDLLNFASLFGSVISNKAPGNFKMKFALSNAVKDAIIRMYHNKMKAAQAQSEYAAPPNANIQATEIPPAPRSVPQQNNPPAAAKPAPPPAPKKAAATPSQSSPATNPAVAGKQQTPKPKEPAPVAAEATPKPANSGGMDFSELELDPDFGNPQKQDK